MTSNTNMPPEMFACNPPKPRSAFMTALIKEFPVLAESLTDHTDDNMLLRDSFESDRQYGRFIQMMSNLEDFNQNRISIFVPEEFTIGGLRPFHSFMDDWNEAAPSEKERELVMNTVQEIAALFTNIKTNLDKISSTKYSKADRTGFLDRVLESIIRLEEILSDEKGLWNARYTDPTKIMTGFYHKICHDVPTKQPFFYRLFLSFMNGMPMRSD